MVAHNQQSAARGNRLGEPTVEPLLLDPGQVHELCRDEIVGRRRGNPLDEVRVQPGDALCYFVADLECVCGAAFQCNGGDIDCGNPPAPLGQPDGVRTFPATDVQRGSRREVTCLGHELGVDLPAPQGAAALVPMVPECFARGLVVRTVPMPMVRMVVVALMVIAVLGGAVPVQS